MQGNLNRFIPPFLLAMWGVFYWLYSLGVVTGLHWVLLGVSHLLCLLVFVNFVYIFNYSYALNVMLLSLLILLFVQPPLINAFISLSISFYGFRLLYFVHKRYAANSYAGNKSAMAEADAKMPLFVKILLWIFVSWLMFYHSFVSWFVATAASLNDFTFYALLIMWLGLALEAVADVQKQAAKQRQPDRFCDQGLFRLCRHPNYLGEIIFIVGMYLVGVSVFDQAYQFVAAGLAPLWIVILMVWSARNGDRKQQEKYGDDAAFQAYVAKVPSLLPRVFTGGRE